MQEENDLKELPKTGTHIVIDYYSGTFPFLCIDEEEELETVNEIVNAVACYINIPMEEINEAEYGKGRYGYLFHLGIGIDLKLKGPYNKQGYRTCMLEMKGTGCREFERRNPDKMWKDLILYTMAELDLVVTRIDIAIDDYSGDLVPFNYVKAKLDKKLYTSTFKKKYYILRGCEEEGYSLNFGSRDSTQELVIYEKNKERQARNILCKQDYWTRFEMRFRHKKANNIAKDIVDAFKGHIKYPESRECSEGIDGFKEFVSSIFLNMLDLKEDSDYDQTNISKAPTDSKWLEFLGNVEKATITPPSKKTPLWTSFEAYTRQVLPLYLLIKLIQSNYNFNQFSKEMLKELYLGLESIIDNKVKINRGNRYIEDNKLDEYLDKNKLQDIKDKIEKKLEEEELPF